MTKRSKDYEDGYNNGFYAALRGVTFAGVIPGMSASDIVETAHETIDEMIKAGKVTGEEPQMVDILIGLVEEAQKDGQADEMIKLLKQEFGVERGNK